MKKINSLIICIMIFFSSFSFSIINAENIDKYNLIAENVIQKVETMENQEIELIDTKILLDIEHNPNYLLILTNNGYIISTIDTAIISEYNLSTDNIPYYDTNENDILIYGGPFNYILSNNENAVLAKSEEKINEISDYNQRFLNLCDDSMLEMNGNFRSTTASYTGISSSRFSRYSSGMWINDPSNYPSSQGYSSGGICGTISSAILLAYYDDYINDNIVPSSIRTRSSSSPGTLIEELFEVIDEPNPSGTLPGDLYEGINSFLYNNAYSLYLTYSPVQSSINAFSKAKTKIDAGCPILIGLLEIRESSYGDHWVVAYQYLDESGTAYDMYKCVDLWGEYDATININWGQGYVCLKN